MNFLISPTAFFQLNTRQALVLYDEIIKAADFKGHEKVLDLYCGIGSIGLYLAHLVEEVRGIDNNEDNIKDATNFASINDIQNAKFYSEKFSLLINLKRKVSFPMFRSLIHLEGEWNLAY